MCAVPSNHGDTPTTQGRADAAGIVLLRNQGPALVEEVERLRAFARDIRDNWDCDEDAHRYDTTCRACEADRVLGEPKEGA